MKMCKFCAIVAIVAGISLFGLESAHAQYNLDYGGVLGASNYLGDIGGTKKAGKGTPRKNFVADIRLDQTKFVVGGWIRYKVHPLLSGKANLAWVRIGGVDSTSDYINRRVRNLSFRNDIIELTGQVEYNFYSLHNISPRGKMVIDFNAYGFAGGGIFWHNPKAEYLDDWYALQPIGTEGQGKIETTNKKGEVVDFQKYKRIQGNLTTGLGFYYTFQRKWRLGWEFSVRKTFTDYLDDVSTRYVDPSILDDGTPEGAIHAALSNRTNYKLAAENGLDLAGATDGIRGNPDHNDWYMTTVATLGYVVRGKGNFYKQKYQLLTGTKKRKKRKTRAKF